MFVLAFVGLAVAGLAAAKGGFDSGNIAQGATYEWTAAAAGTYKYHCKIHPAMTGTVTVTEAGASAEVMIISFAFDPPVITVGAGDAVTWMNHDAATHTAATDDDGVTLESGNGTPGFGALIAALAVTVALVGMGRRRNRGFN